MADKNFRSYPDTSNIVIENETIESPDSSYSDTLKFSNTMGATVRACHITGGAEDCVDMNRGCFDITLEDTTLEPKGKYGATIKGGTHFVTFRNVTFLAHGSEYDIDIGNWSDQSAELTKDITLKNVTSADGKPVHVRVLWGEKPEVIGGNVKVTVIPKIFVQIYRWLRKHNLVK